jgi:hypothetical protein
MALCRTCIDVIVLAAVTTSAYAAQVPANWLGGNGKWDNASKWSTGVVPNNGADTYAVNIDNGNAAASVVMAIGVGPPNYVIDSLTIDASDKLILQREG